MAMRVHLVMPIMMQYYIVSQGWPRPQLVMAAANHGHSCGQGSVLAMLATATDNCIDVIYYWHLVAE